LFLFIQWSVTPVPFFFNSFCPVPKLDPPPPPFLKVYFTSVRLPFFCYSLLVLCPKVFLKVALFRPVQAPPPFPIWEGLVPPWSMNLRRPFFLVHIGPPVARHCNVANPAVRSAGWGPVHALSEWRFPVAFGDRFLLHSSSLARRRVSRSPQHLFFTFSDSQHLGA